MWQKCRGEVGRGHRFQIKCNVVLSPLVQIRNPKPREGKSRTQIGREKTVRFLFSSAQDRRGRKGTIANRKSCHSSCLHSRGTRSMKLFTGVEASEFESLLEENRVCLLSHSKFFNFM